jgi:hypothetical protein
MSTLFGGGGSGKGNKTGDGSAGVTPMEASLGKLMSEEADVKARSDFSQGLGHSTNMTLAAAGGRLGATEKLMGMADANAAAQAAGQADLSSLLGQLASQQGGTNTSGNTTSGDNPPGSSTGSFSAQDTVTA